MKWLVAALVLMLAMPAVAQDRGAVERQFRQWIETDIRPAARARGVSDAVIDGALGSVRPDWDLPGLVPPGSGRDVPRENRQAEFSAPSRYFSPNNIETLVNRGKSLLGQHRSTLTRIEQRYGVPSGIILAIWGRESAYGAASIPHDAFRILATKGFMSTRPELFTVELLGALEILAKGYATAGQMKSSWAGAMGQPQFLPTSYLNYAVDFDGDGRRNIWTSVPDTLASIANYLKEKGWQAGRDWGFEVALPPTLDCSLEGPDRRKAIAEWEQDGIIRVTGRAFPENERRGQASIMMPAGRYGPEFLVTPNFYVIKEYNESDLYALFVGHVADRIMFGTGSFLGEWRKVDTMLRSDIASMQRVLERQGMDVGGADGLPGFKTRRSIGTWQKANGERPTCFPSQALLRKVR